MGAAAFLIAEFTGISYFDLIKHAALPALVSYVALFYIVHLEVTKLGLKGLPRQTPTQGLLRRMTGFIAGFAALAVTGGLIHLAVGLVGGWVLSLSLPAVMLIFIAAYVVLVRIAAREADLEIGLSDAEMKLLPTVSASPHRLPLRATDRRPSVVCPVSRLSPSLSAYWACLRWSSCW